MVGGAAAGSDPARDLYKIYQRFCAFGKGHRVRLSLAGADAANFLKLEDCATRWEIDVNGASEVALPVWSE